MDQELADAAAHTPSRQWVCTHQMAALFCLKWHHGGYFEIMTSHQKSNSVSRCDLLKEKFCQMLSRSDWKRRSALGFFEEVSSTIKEEQQQIE